MYFRLGFGAAEFAIGSPLEERAPLRGDFGLIDTLSLFFELETPRSYLHFCFLHTLLQSFSYKHFQ